MTRPRFDAALERLLVRERSRAPVTRERREHLAALVRATAARLETPARPSWRERLGAALRPALALGAFLALAGAAYAVVGGWGRTALPTRRPAPPTNAPPAERGLELREEIELLSHARRALEERAYERAAQHLAEHTRRFPAGALMAEREGLSVMLLWHAGHRDAAVRAAERFQARYPGSPLNRPIRALVDGKGPGDAPDVH